MEDLEEWRKKAEAQMNGMEKRCQQRDDDKELKNITDEKKVDDIIS